MPRKRIGKAIGARSARKLIREVGGDPAVDLQAEEKRVVGTVLGELTRLADGRIVRTFYGSGDLFESENEYRRLLATIGDSRRRSDEHPLGTRFPGGAGFVAAVPTLLEELPAAMAIPPEWLDGSVDSLERLDRAARRIGGPECLDRPEILTPFIAYVGEVMRNAVGGGWEITVQEKQWQPVIVAEDGRRLRPFRIFKELLEDGSVWAVVHVEIRRQAALRRPVATGVFAGREARVVPAAGALGTLPEAAYETLKRYGSGHPWTVRFHDDVELEGFPFKAGTEAWFKRSGPIIGGVISRTATFAEIEFPPGTQVSFYSGHRDGRLGSAKPGSDAVLQGVPCKRGKLVQFRIRKGRSYVAAATLACAWTFQGERCPAGAFIELDHRGRLQRWMLW